MTTWVKVYDTLRGHVKSLTAGDRAMWLYVCGLSYSNEHRTDGFIARRALPAVAPGVKAPERLAAKLVEAGLWHTVEGGWTIHDYLDVQRSAEEIADHRRRDADRKAEERASTKSPRGQVVDESQTPERVHALDKNREETETEKTTAMRRVFDAWLASTGKTGATQLDPKRRKVIAAALKAYPLEDVLDAVDGWRFSPHHRGENERHTVYNDLSLLLRDAEKIEKFRDLKRAGSRPSNVVAIQAGRNQSGTDYDKAAGL